MANCLPRRLRRADRVHGCRLRSAAAVLRAKKSLAELTSQGLRRHTKTKSNKMLAVVASPLAFSPQAPGSVPLTRASRTTSPACVLQSDMNRRAALVGAGLTALVRTTDARKKERTQQP